jgi:ribosomal protein S18 acetylase RimI-like enzyme
MIEVSGAPKIDGLVFRRFRDKSDYSVMSSVGKRSWEADKVDQLETEEELANEYESLSNRDSSSEVIIAEVMGEPVAYGRIWSEPWNSGERVFWHIAHAIPEWRKTNLRLAIFRFNEMQIRFMAKNRPWAGKTSCGAWALDEPNDWREMVLAEGYTPVMHFYEMVRQSLEDIPDNPLPKGLELRSAKPEHYPEIWNATKEAFRDKPWFIESRYDREHYDLWLNWSTFMPDLWQVAWDGDHVAGMAQNHVPLEENRVFDRKRGHTQNLFVLPRWRRRGLAKALLAKSLVVMRERGLKEATLDVETQNTSGELQLYESMGYRVARKYAHYKKPLDLDNLPRTRHKTDQS